MSEFMMGLTLVGIAFVGASVILLTGFWAAKHGWWD